MEQDQTHSKIIVAILKTDALKKKILMSCNLAYPDDDALNLTNWLYENIDWWTYKQTHQYIIFTFDNVEDATLFTLTYL